MNTECLKVKDLNFATHGIEFLGKSIKIQLHCFNFERVQQIVIEATQNLKEISILLFIQLATGFILIINQIRFTKCAARLANEQQTEAAST